MPKSTKPKPRYSQLRAQNKPQVGHCKLCLRTVLTARYDALIVHFDPQPLSQLGEVQALILGLRTFWVFQPHIYKRTAEAIKASPHGRGGLIFRTHWCDGPQPTGAATNFHISDYGDDPGF